MDGPVVKAAQSALATGKVILILPWVPQEAEAELKDAFEKTLAARKLGRAAQEVADYWFFETAVRLHREGEGAAYTGLKPAGLDWGPIVRRAERALENGDAREVLDFLLPEVEEELQARFNHAMAKRRYDDTDVDAARAYVQATLGFVLFAHQLYTTIKGHEEHGEERLGGHEH